MTDKQVSHCGEAQVGQPLFNLAFSDNGGAERACILPAGQHILVPVNVVEVSFAEFPGAKTEDDLHRLAEEDESSNPFLFLSIDGTSSATWSQLMERSLTTSRNLEFIQEALDVNFPNHPIFGVPGPSRAVSDGYWVILESLPAGVDEDPFQGKVNESNY